MTKKEMNMSNEDVEAPVKDVDVKPVDGAKEQPDGASQDDMAAKNANTKIEQVSSEDDSNLEEPEEKKDEMEVEEPEEEPSEMEKVVAIIEEINNKLDAFEARLAELEKEEADEKGEIEEQPEPPVTEKLSLNKVFVENISNSDNGKNFNKIAREIIY